MSFFIIPGNIFSYDLKPNEIAVFAFLCSCADNKTFDCFPSVKKIAKVCNMGQSTVRAVIHALQEKGLIKIKSQYKLVPDTDKRRQTSNLYHVSFLEECRKEEREMKQFYKSMKRIPHSKEGVPPGDRDQLTKPNITTTHIENKPSGSQKSCPDVSVSSNETDFSTLRDACVQELTYYGEELSCCGWIVHEALNSIWNDLVFDSDNPLAQRKLILKHLNAKLVVKVLNGFEIDGAYHTYLDETIRFVRWCKEQPPHPSIGHKPRTLEECRVYVDDYLKYNISRNLSAWSIKVMANSIAKLYGCSSREFIPTPQRKRSNITRSRGSKVRDKNYSEKNNQDVLLLNRVVGMRRSELAQIRGSDLMFIEGNPYIKISRGTKGGKVRYSELAGHPEEIEKVVEMFRSAGNKKLCPHPNSNIDFHGLRREYAKSLYSKYATDYSEYSKCRLLVYKHKIIGSYTTKNGRKSVKEFNRLCKELNISSDAKGLCDVSGVYHCRNDLKNVHYSREALYIVSSNLGHNRADVSIFYLH